MKYQMAAIAFWIGLVATGLTSEPSLDKIIVIDLDSYASNPFFGKILKFLIAQDFFIVELLCAAIAILLVAKEERENSSKPSKKADPSA